MTKNNNNVILMKIRQLIKLTDFLFRTTFGSPFSLILLFGAWVVNLIQPIVQIFNFEYEKNVSVNCSITTIFTVAIFFIWNMLYQTQGKAEVSGSNRLINIRPISKTWLYIAHLISYTIILLAFLIPLALTPTITERISEHLITDNGAPYYFRDILTAIIFCCLPVLTIITTKLCKKKITFFILLFNLLSIFTFVITAIILGDKFQTDLLVSSAIIIAIIFTLFILSASITIIFRNKLAHLSIPLIFILGFFFFPVFSKLAIFRIFIPPYGQSLNIAITSPSWNQVLPYILYSLAYSIGVIAISLLVTTKEQ